MADTFNLTKADFEGNFKTAPGGTYHVRILPESKIKPSKSGSGNNLEIRAMITRGPHKGIKFFDTIAPHVGWKIAQLVTALDLGMKKGTLQKLRKKIIGEELRAILREKEFQGKTRNEVVQWLPLKGAVSADDEDDFENDDDLEDDDDFEDEDDDLEDDDLEDDEDEDEEEDEEDEDDEDLEDEEDEDLDDDDDEDDEDDLDDDEDDDEEEEDEDDFDDEEEDEEDDEDDFEDDDDDDDDEEEVKPSARRRRSPSKKSEKKDAPSSAKTRRRRQ